MLDIQESVLNLYEGRILNDDEFAKQVYAALTNIVWVHRSGLVCALTFREAGGLIADIRERGSYKDWYCSSAEGVVSDEVALGMRVHGWEPREYPRD